MNELSDTTISSQELQKFIKNGDSSNYNLAKATMWTWVPTVDYKWL